ncbi:hypothetical protein HK097_005448, partial [Rhizophlyctis rosea]
MSAPTDTPTEPPVLLSSSHSARGFGKLFGKLGKKEKEKEKEREGSSIRGKISGPSNFTKVDGATADVVATVDVGDASSRAGRGADVVPIRPVVQQAVTTVIGFEPPQLEKEQRRREEFVSHVVGKEKEKRVKKKGSKMRDGVEGTREDGGGSGSGGVVAAFQKVKKERWERGEREREERRRERESQREREKEREKERERERSKVSAAKNTGKERSATKEVVEEQTHSSTKLKFPFLNKSLFAPKGREPTLPGPVVESGLKRRETIGSTRSTLRRRVGTGRPPSGATIISWAGGNGTYPPFDATSKDPTSTSPTQQHQQPEIPILLQKCIKLVEEIGLDTEGLYRISGSAATVQRLRHLFDLDPSRVELHPPTKRHSTLSSSHDLVAVLPRRASRLSLAETVSSGGGGAVSRSSLDIGPASSSGGVTRTHTHTRRISTSSIPPGVAGQVLGSSLYDNDVHVVTGVVKGFLRDGIGAKREPLCTFDLYEGFVGATQIGDWRNRLIAIQDMVHALPVEHFLTLKFVCEHLKRVSEHSERNRMSVRNLAIIMGQNLMRPPPALDSLARIMNDMPYQCTCVETLIEQCEWVFGPIEFEEEVGVEGWEEDEVPGAFEASYEGAEKVDGGCEGDVEGEEEGNWEGSVLETQ